MRFRIAVREAEAWLLADAVQMGKFLGVRQSLIPAQPDALPDPKQTLVNLARRSRRQAVKLDMVPAEGTNVRVGPAYVPRIIEYASQHWRPRVAAQRSESLRRTINSLKDWAAG